MARVVNEVHIVEDGDAALDFLRRAGRYASAPRPDIVLLDLNLPRRDGREVLAEVKSDPALRTIPVVVLTTSDDEHDVLQSYGLHANCYLTKPVEFQSFMRAIRSIASGGRSVNSCKARRTFCRIVIDPKSAPLW